MPRKARVSAVHTLTDLIPRLRGAASFEQVVSALQRGERASIDGAWGSSCALVAAALAEAHEGWLITVLPRLRDVDDFVADVQSLLGGPPLEFPAWESLPDEHSISDSVFGRRLRLLSALEPRRHGPGRGRGDTLPERGRSSDGPVPSESVRSGEVSGSSSRMIVTSLAALLQPVPSRGERAGGRRELCVGGRLDHEAFLQWLVARGFERTSAVERPGEFAVHGGILDVFPPEARDPLRIELFGDEIDSLRSFDIETQRTIERLTQAELTVVSPVSATDRPSGPGESLFDTLPRDAWLVLAEPGELVEEGRQYLDRLRDPRGHFSVAATLSRCLERPCVSVSAIAEGREAVSLHLQTESIERFTGPRTEVLCELARVVDRDEQVLIACHNEGERERLGELLAQHDAERAARLEAHPTERDSADGGALTAPLSMRVRLCVGNVTRGYRLSGERLFVLSDHELFSRVPVRRESRRRAKAESRAIDTFLDLNVGDLVVHLTHGIARYRGMELLERGTVPGGAAMGVGRAETAGGAREEHLILEFRDRMRMYVPVSLIHLVQKYIGGAKLAPTLSKLGGSGWAARKDRVAGAVADMAADMLRLQAERESRPGIAHPADSHWQTEFEASFPYVETDDQLEAIAQAKADLERSRPMDRLICGDVGFGKTEVAMRAAFKVVDAGRQVAVLVPTTVLAEQHFRTFCDRLAEYPFTIEVLSRFRSRSEQRTVLQGMEQGTVDIVIGTHRLVQKDVRFKDLGLLIIDEEQRFGVDAKEMLKRIRLAVDVLTLTATPIPRTLHLSLLGIRDISSLTTPPQDRVAIETRTLRWDGSFIRHAIIRELNRGGQCYFVHNRVYNIRSIADRLQSIIPEATIGIVHGQMADDDIEESMLDFVRGKTDVLVATTIIESGLDIPNANTIFIHQADRYGLADLHQLRGRVGRYKHRAYCYLVLEEGRSITSVAAKRLKAIEEYSELGSGFKIAMRDLEIRGAGNILGTEQSGHIAAVGYELYCQLLERAVQQLKGETPRERPYVNIDLPVAAYVPDEYVPPGRHKIEVYRRISGAGDSRELQDVAAALRDRYGPPPPEVQQLLTLRELQLRAFLWGVDGIRLEDRFAVFSVREPRRVAALRRRIGTDLRLVDDRQACLVVDRRLDGEALVKLLLDRLAE
jgi:transcription-repair coupling factor (superfamily II helicase)